MIQFPHSKINLGLHIVHRRPDGYHDLETCFYPTPLCDVLEIIPSTKMEFTTSGIPVPGLAEQNLCLKAYHLLQKNYDIPPVKIHLLKKIPTGSGLGGGSSNAAFTLMMLNEIFDLKIPENQLLNFAEQLGSDSPYFIKKGPQLASGKGEILTPFDITLKGCLVLVKPPVFISSAEAFHNVDPKLPIIPLKSILKTPVKDWKEKLINDFEYVVFKDHLNIAKVKEKLYELGATYASMSGSGSVVYAIFDEAPNVASQFKGCNYWEFNLN